MKQLLSRLLGALLGAAIFAAISYGLVELFAAWYGPRYIKSDDDIGHAFMWSLGFMLAALIGGGVLGFWLVERRTPSP